MRRWHVYRRASEKLRGVRSLMEKMALPSSLQVLVFAGCFDQSMEKVALPMGLQTLTFGEEFDGVGFNQPMQKVALPSGLQNLTFGQYFRKSMEQVQ